MRTISGNAVHDIRCLLEGGGDIRERADGAEGDCTRGLLPEGIDDEVDGVTFRQRHLRVGKLRAVQAGLAVDMFRCNKAPFEGGIAPGIDGDICPPRQFANDAGVAFREVQRNVPGNGGDAEKLDFLRRSKGQEDRDGVVLAGVGVYDDLARAHGATGDTGPVPVQGISVNLGQQRRMAGGLPLDKTGGAE